MKSLKILVGALLALTSIIFAMDEQGAFAGDYTEIPSVLVLRSQPISIPNGRQRLGSIGAQGDVPSHGRRYSYHEDDEEAGQQISDLLMSVAISEKMNGDENTIGQAIQSLAEVKSFLDQESDAEITKAIKLLSVPTPDVLKVSELLRNHRVKVNCESPKEGVERMSSNLLGRKVFSVVRQLEWLMEPSSPLKGVVSGNVSAVPYSISGAANDLLNLQDEIGMLVDDWLNCEDPNVPAAIRTVSVVIEKLSGIKSGLEMVLAKASLGNTKKEERLQFEEDTDS